MKQVVFGEQLQKEEVNQVGSEFSPALRLQMHKDSLCMH